MGDAGTPRIGLQSLAAVVDREVHVFHWHDTELHGVTQHQGPNEADLILEGHSEGFT